ncbi:hypothetical protein KM043_003637 [Ampulex compressa]|nr:hypothetical protein KM043_003637 [Ampulex compressa]
MEFGSGTDIPFSRRRVDGSQFLSQPVARPGPPPLPLLQGHPVDFRTPTEYQPRDDSERLGFSRSALDCALKFAWIILPYGYGDSVSKGCRLTCAFVSYPTPGLPAWKRENDAGTSGKEPSSTAARATRREMTNDGEKACDNSTDSLANLGRLSTLLLQSIKHPEEVGVALGRILRDDLEDFGKIDVG